MEKQEFDLNKNYTWDENSQVILTGKQYGFIRHFVNMIIGSPEAQRVMLGMEIAGFLQGILEEGIKQGWVKEKEPEVGDVMKTESATGVNQTVIKEFKSKENE